MEALKDVSALCLLHLSAPELEINVITPGLKTWRQNSSKVNTLCCFVVFVVVNVWSHDCAGSDIINYDAPVFIVDLIIHRFG